MSDEPTIGAGITIDVDALLRSRLLLTAMSGAGKSWALRRLLEQTHGMTQQIVIDPEGEFFTLRERFDFVLAGGDGADCAAEPRSAKLLARRLLELGCSAILDIYELDHRARREFVKRFLDSMISAPKRLWHPCLVVVDEAQQFCPEGKPNEASDAVVALMERGRKRGFGGVLATQRISKLGKDALAEAQNVLVGRSILDRDVKRATDLLGLEARAGAKAIRGLADGEFFAIGPAFPTITELVPIRTGSVDTTHPHAGGAQPPAPAAPAEISAMLSQLADLPEAAEAEAADLEAARERIAVLERDLEAARAGVDPEAEAAAGRRALEQAREAADARLGWYRGRVEAAIGSGLEAVGTALDGAAGQITGALVRLDELRDALGEIDMGEAPQLPDRAPVRGPARLKPLPPPSRRPPPSEGLDGPMQRILDGMAALEQVRIPMPWSRAIVAFLASYKPTTGSFQNALGRLRGKGLISYPQPGTLALEHDGRALARAPAEILTTDDLHARIRGLVDGPMWRCLEPLIAAYPQAVGRDALARKAGYANRRVGAYQNALGRLRGLGVIDYPDSDHAVALEILFPDRARR